MVVEEAMKITSSLFLIAWRRWGKKLDFEIFLTPPQSLEEAHCRSVEFDEKYIHELSKRWFSCLLFVHEYINSNLLNTLHLWEIVQTTPHMSIA
jgi:hypothetical protein